MSFRSIGLLIVLLICVGDAVDRAKFITCNQSGFCRRNRGLEVGQSKHVISNVRLGWYGTVSFDLTNPSDTAKPFVGEIISFENDEIIRIRIKEKYPSRKRFDISDDVIVPTVQKSSFKSVSSPSPSESKIELVNGKSLIIKHDPVLIELVDSKGEKLMSLNSRGLFNFEAYRTKEEDLTRLGIVEKKIDEIETGDQSQPASPTLPEGLWTETFSSHTDSKPHGPSSFGIDVVFHNSLNVYGIPEHASHFSLPVTKGVTDPYRLYNLDVFEYELDNPMALYGAVPFMLSHGEKGTNAMLWLNPSETWIDVSKDENAKSTTTHWFSESGDFDVFLMSSTDPYDISKLYGKLTGTTPIPPMFSIAYHQCRWNYKDEADVSQVDGGFDENDIPYDVLWLDIEHTDSKKYFTWDSLHFPSPQRMQDEIAAKKRKMVTIVDPHIKRDGGYYVHKEAEEKGLYVKSHTGSDYEGWCWPGSSSWLDFSNSLIRQWWAEKFSYASYQHSTNILFIWNDMNEPSVFNGPETTMHKDAIHANGVEHRELHNAYGFYYHQATALGLVERNPEKNERSFVLSRAFFSGTQRTSAIWTGDNTAHWSHLEYSIPMLLSINIAGITFSGGDVGGFFGNPDAELSTRWYQAAAFQPFFRGHAHLDTKRREPWLYGEPTTTYIRNAIRRRYQLLPYFYTLYAEANRTGIPIMRPLWFEFPKDTQTFTSEDSYLLGKSLLIRPVMSAGQTTVSVRLPGEATDRWFEYEGSGTAQKGGITIEKKVPINEIAVYQRGGSIIPKKERTRRASHMMVDDPYTLQIALDQSGKAEGELYIDDGSTFNYLKGDFLNKKFVFDGQNLISTTTHSSKSFTNAATVEKIVIKGYNGTPSKVSVGTTSLTFSVEDGNLVIRKPDLPISDEWTISIQ